MWEKTRETAQTSASQHEEVGERWFVATTLPRKEAVAVANLELQGFKAYCPLQRVTRRHARKLQTIMAPVFSGYTFVLVDTSSKRWNSINSTRGVRFLICDESGPVPVRKGIVESLLQSTDSDGTLRFASRIKPGDKARLITGPFAEQLGVIEHLDGKGRVRMLFEILGRKARITVQPQDVSLV